MYSTIQYSLRERITFEMSLQRNIIRININCSGYIKFCYLLSARPRAIYGECTV